jgi:hypothetical protein
MDITELILKPTHKTRTECWFFVYSFICPVTLSFCLLFLLSYSYFQSSLFPVSPSFLILTHQWDNAELVHVLFLRNSYHGLLYPESLSPWTMGVFCYCDMIKRFGNWIQWAAIWPEFCHLTPTACTGIMRNDPQGIFENFDRVIQPGRLGLPLSARRLPTCSKARYDLVWSSFCVPYFHFRFQFFLHRGQWW